MNLRAWCQAARPKTLAASISPVVVGAGLAGMGAGLRPLPLAATLLTALLLQVGANLANDVSDFVRGADRPGRLGPQRVTQTGVLPARSVAGGAAVCFAAAEALSLYLGAASGPLVPVVCLLAIAAAAAYSGGPWPYGYHGLGDLFVFLFFGPAAVLGTVYVQTRQVGAADVMAAVAVGLLVDAILVANNLRDLEPDRQSGKRTLAVRVGTAATRWQYAVWMLLPYGLPLGVRLAGAAGPSYWLPWLSLPLALALVRAVVLAREPRALNPLLARTAGLQLLFGALFAAGQLL